MKPGLQWCPSISMVHNLKFLTFFLRRGRVEKLGPQILFFGVKSYMNEMSMA